MILRRHSRVVGVLRIINIAKECNNGEREGLEKEGNERRERWKWWPRREGGGEEGRNFMERRRMKKGKKRKKKYTSDIINDFSVIIGVFTDLESVVDLSATVFTLASCSGKHVKNFARYPIRVNS